MATCSVLSTLSASTRKDRTSACVSTAIREMAPPANSFVPVSITIIIIISVLSICEMGIHFALRRVD